MCNFAPSFIYYSNIMEELLRAWLDNLDYWNILLLMAIESSFIPFPSEVVVPPAACMACMSGSHLNIFMVVLVATVGACIGAMVNYYLARTLGRVVVYKFADSRLGHICLLNGEKVERAENYFREHGVASTFFGRLVPAVRQLISIPAGLAKMDIKKFLFFTALGAGLWNTVLALLGYLIHVWFPELQSARDISDKAKEYSHEIGYAILAIVAVVAVWFLWKYIKKRKMEKD